MPLLMERSVDVFFSDTLRQYRGDTTNALLRICSHLFILSYLRILLVELSLLPPQVVLSNEKSDGALRNKHCAIFP